MRLEIGTRVQFVDYPQERGVITQALPEGADAPEFQVMWDDGLDGWYIPADLVALS